MQGFEDHLVAKILRNIFCVQQKGLEKLEGEKMTFTYEYEFYILT